MFCRFNLVSIMAAMILSGCAASPQSSDPTVSESATKFFKPVQVSAADFSQGPTEINVLHAISRTDDGSAVYVTVDGKDAGALIRGQSLQLHLPAGEHQVGGYVPTLLGFGRVTIQSVKITTAEGQVKQVAYSINKNKPMFAETGSSPG